MYHRAVRLFCASCFATAYLSASDVDARDTRGYSPVMWAAAKGDVAAVQELIQRGARLNLRGRDGLTAFSVSMANGHGKIPPLLVRAGADCLSPSAVWQKELQTRNTRAAGFLNEVERLGLALIRAAEEGDRRELTALLKQGAPTGFLSQRRETALMIAARRNDLAAARTLLSGGARVTDDHIDFLSPFDAPSLSSEMRRLLLSAKPSAPLLAPGRLSRVNYQLYAAIQRGDANGVRAAIGNEADPNARWGLKPAIVLAAEKNSQALVKTLLEAGARPTAEDIAELRETGTIDREVLRLLDGGQSRARLQNALSRLEKFGVKFGSGELQESAQWLFNRASQSTSGVSEEYIQQLETTVKTLTDAPEASQKEIVQEATTELKAKADHCRQSGVWLGGKVPVAATTRRAETIVNNWQVFYRPRIFAHAQGAAAHLIPSWTSPARQSIEPGRYHFWAVEPATGQRSAVIEQSIIGRDEVPVIIPLP